MCSIIDVADVAPSRAAALVALVEHRAEIGRRIAELLRDPRLADVDGEPVDRVDLGALPTEVAAELTTLLLTDADRGVAAATVLAGQVSSTTGPGTGTLIAGRYASASRWLQVEAGFAPSSAKAVLARCRDLREHSASVQDAWLTGGVSGDAVRELTSGVTGALRPVRTTREERARLRSEALQVLLPVAAAGTVAEVKRAVGRLRLLADSAYEEQAAVEAYDDQSLTCVRVGDHTVITATLTHENGAAAMTVIDQHARRIADRDPRVVHDPACPLALSAPSATSATSSTSSDVLWCTCGAAAAAGVVAKDRWPHLLAVAFAEHMHDQLDRGQVGSHHRVAPHVTVTVSLDELRAGLGGELALPGSDDPAPLGSASVRRILCDASVTPVVVQRLQQLDPAARSGRLAQLLLQSAVAVLYVGRADRTATPAQRRALEIRDRHCIFPGCRAHPRRCQAHHVVEWENQGATDLSNLALLCRRHHISVHEGGWTISRTPGTGPHESGCWAVTPPRPGP